MTTTRQPAGKNALNCLLLLASRSAMTTDAGISSLISSAMTTIHQLAGMNAHHHLGKKKVLYALRTAILIRANAGKSENLRTVTLTLVTVFGLAHHHLGKKKKVLYALWTAMLIRANAGTSENLRTVTLTLVTVFGLAHHPLEEKDLKILHAFPTAVLRDAGTSFLMRNVMTRVIVR